MFGTKPMASPTFARPFWQKRAWVYLWWNDSRATSYKHCRHYTFLGRTAVFKATLATRMHSFFASTVAAAAEASDLACQRRMPVHTKRATRTTHTPAPLTKAALDLKQRLSTLRISSATQDDLHTIWQLLHHPSVHCSSQLLQFKPQLITMIYRLVAVKGTADMMSTLHRELLQLGIPTTLRDMEWAILCNLRANRVDTAQKLIQQLYQATETPSMTIYNQILKFYCKKPNLAERRRLMELLLENMTQRGLTPDTQTYYQLLLGDAMHGTSNDTYRWFDKLMALESANGLKRPNRVKRLVETLASRGHPMILSVLKRAHEGGVLLDLSTWNAAVRGCASAGHMASATEIVDYMHHHANAPTPTLETYHTLIRGYLGELRRTSPTKEDMSAAVNLFQTLLDRGIVASQQVYESFIRGYLRHNTLSDDDLRSGTLRRLWQAIMSLDKKDLPISDDTVVPLLLYYQQKGEFSDAEQVYLDLRTRKQPLNRRLLGAIDEMIGAFADRKHVLSAVTMVYDLLGDGHRPSSSTLCAIIRACGARCDLEAAQQLFVIMKEQDPGFALSDVCYATLVSEYARVGRMEEAHAMYMTLLDQTTNKGIKKQASDAMVRGYVSAGDIPRAEEIWRQRGIKSTTALNAMVEGYARKGDWAAADVLLTHPEANATTEKIWIQAKLEQGKLDEAQARLSDAIERHGPRNLVGAVYSVLDVCAVQQRTDNCEKWFKVLKTVKAATARAHESMILCYQSTGQLDKAKRLQQSLRRLPTPRISNCINVL